ncbi:putative uncharacterized protein C5orf58 homolog isoform X2 [Anas acuta]|uniref:putative uncharacterized protein C5orf58 homolog isoform X2 n=1 Tax=Anas platyrhynchos TaxID=8839 RepID=UPI0035C8E4EF
MVIIHGQQQNRTKRSAGSWLTAQTSRGSLAQTDNLHSKPLSEGKRDESKESLSNVFRNDAADQQFNLEAAIKNVGKMSDELKKLNVESQLLLCDLILNFNHPLKAKDLREAEEKTRSLTD